MDAISQCHTYFSFIWPFESGNVERKVKIQKLEYFKNEKSSLDKIKSIFQNF